MLIFQLFLQISEICFHKALVQYIKFMTGALYLRKVKHQQETYMYVSILAIFGTFSRKSSEIHPKWCYNFNFIKCDLTFFNQPIRNNLFQLQVLSKILFNDHSAVK